MAKKKKSGTSPVLVILGMGLTALILWRLSLKKGTVEILPLSEGVFDPPPGYVPEIPYMGPDQQILLAENDWRQNGYQQYDGMISGIPCSKRIGLSLTV